MQTLVLAILCSLASIANPVNPMMTVSIPDPVFEQRLIDLSIDSDGIINGQILETDAAAVTNNLDLIGLGIQNLGGIEAFTNITGLLCNSNNLDTLDIGALTQLVDLRCQNNSLDTIIGLENLSLLESIYCQQNELTSLQIGGLTNLVDVICSSNQISSLDVDNLPNLWRLDCYVNNLSELQFDDNPNLTILGCGSNDIEILNLNNLPGLILVNCNSNEMESLGLNALPSLTHLSCEINNLDSIDVSAFPLLFDFRCFGNDLTFLDVRNGNNVNFSFFRANQNPNLQCINVDEPAWSLENWSMVDPIASFSTDCIICGPMTDQDEVDACGFFVSNQGDTINASGMYMDTLTNVLLCDSFLLLDISIYQHSFDTIIELHCDSFAVPSGHETYFTSGIYQDTIPNMVGCDSIITINLTINQSSSSIIDTAVCQEYLVPSGAPLLTESGIYSDTIPNLQGCDSVITILLTILCSSDSIEVFACDEYTVPSGDETYFSSGSYMDTIENAIGYDSILTIQLTVNSNSSQTIDVSACSLYVVPSGDEFYLASGIYSDTIPNLMGCDSVLTINLTVYPEDSAARDWQGFGTGLGDYGVGSSVEVDGEGNVFVCGSFQESAGAPGQHIAKWDGTSWSPLGAGLPFTAWAMVLDEENDHVYAGGQFSGPQKWDGSSWSVVGWPQNPGHTFTLEEGPDGHLYAGGPFAEKIKKWDGSVWSSLGGGLTGTCYSIAFAPNGDLYAAGFLSMAGGVPVNNIAKWDGTTWSALGDGLNNFCQSIAVDAFGHVYAGGGFTMAGGIPVNKVAKWDGTAWSAIGTGVNSSCREVMVDDCNNIYFGGDFSSAGGLDANRIAKWDGFNWDTLNAGIGGSSGFVDGITFDDAGDIYATGFFSDFFQSTAKWSEESCEAIVDTNLVGALNNVFGCVVSGDTIQFDSCVFGDTIVLSASINIALAEVYMVADTSWNITIDASMLPNAFIVFEDASFWMEGITLISGTDPNGGGFFNVGDLTLNNMKIEDNPSVPDGALLVNQGTMTLLGDTQIGN